MISTEDNIMLKEHYTEKRMVRWKTQKMNHLRDIYHDRNTDMQVILDMYDSLDKDHFYVYGRFKDSETETKGRIPTIKSELVAFYSALPWEISTKVRSYSRGKWLPSKKMVLLIPEFVHAPWEDVEDTVHWVINSVNKLLEIHISLDSITEICWIVSDYNLPLQRALTSSGMTAYSYTPKKKHIMFTYLLNDFSKEKKDIISNYFE